MPAPLTVHITQEVPTMVDVVVIVPPFTELDIGITEDELIEPMSPPLMSLELVDDAGAALAALLLHMPDVELAMQ